MLAACERMNAMSTMNQHAPLRSITIGDLLDERAAMHPNNECIVYPFRDIRWTWADFRDVCNRVARGLMAMCIGRGDHVSIWATNVPEWIVLEFATAKIGAVLVTVNTNYKQFELEYLLRQSDTKLLALIGHCKDSDYVAHVNGLLPELASLEGELQSERLPFLKSLVYIDGAAGEHAETPKGMVSFDELYRLAETVPEEKRAALQAALDPQDVIMMLYTSGTTGFPKGVMLTHYNLVNNGLALGDGMKFTPDDRLLIHVPFFHCFGCVLGIMAAVTHGTTMVINESFHPVRAMEAIERERCTAVHGVPTMYIAMLDHEDFPKYNFSSLRTGIMAGSPCPTKVMQQVIDQMHMNEIVIVFGQTESSPGITMTTTDDSVERRVSTVGRVLPYIEAKIIDPETGELCPPEVPGEIVARGYNIMKGYYKMPEATRAAVDEQGWLHTGDIGTMDAEGYVKITGRLKDMIIRGGENIYPREIEEFMYTHPGILDVQVIGVPDKKYGEEVMAYVVPREGETLVQEEIIEFVKKGLSRYKAPRYVAFIDAFPMTASGKIQKFKLREQAILDLNLQEAANIETA